MVVDVELRRVLSAVAGRHEDGVHALVDGNQIDVLFAPAHLVVVDAYTAKEDGTSQS